MKRWGRRNLAETQEGTPPKGRSRPAQTEAETEGSSPFEGLTVVQEKLLEDPTRREIVRVLRETPGLNKSQLRRRVDVLRNTLEFHLSRLEERNIVLTRQVPTGNEVLCFLAADEHLWADERTRVLFGRASNREIALYIAEHEGPATREIADAVDLEPVTVLHHLETLREHDLVDRVRTGNNVSYFPSSALEAWVDEVGDAYGRPWAQDEP